MTKRILHIFLSLLTTLVATLVHAQPGGAYIAFTGARLITGTEAPAIENGVLLIRDDRIEAVGIAHGFNPVSGPGPRRGCPSRAP